MQMLQITQETGKRLNDLAAKLEEKDATSPEKALTAEELALTPPFKDAIQRRLCKSGIFVEFNGKYFLTEQRLKAVRETLDNRGFNPQIHFFQT